MSYLTLVQGARGAKATATRKRIILQTLVEARQSDWARLVGQDAWTALTQVQVSAYAVTAVDANGNEVALSFDAAVRGPDGSEGPTISKLFWNAWNQLGSPRPLGDISTQVTFGSSAACVVIEGALVEIRSVLVKAIIRVLHWSVNVNLAAGHLLKNDAGGLVYGQLTSATFDWQQIMQAATGHEMTEEEYARFVEHAQLTVDLDRAKRFLRVVFIQKSEDRPRQTTAV